MNNPFVSIIIPAFNPGKYILDTIKSVLNQTYQNIEIILVDDGSTEPLENLIQDHFPSNDKINYYSKENGGLSSARNFGITKASGDFIAFLDSDDCWANNKLEIQIKYVSKYDLI
jgi:glycosyltransferase involved in cell wall biosynthesis